MRAFTADEERAIYLARDHGVSITDLSAALDRDPAVVSKHAIRIGVPFATRTVKAQRGPRRNRPVVTLTSLLALAAYLSRLFRPPLSGTQHGWRRKRNGQESGYEQGRKRTKTGRGGRASRIPSRAARVRPQAARATPALAPRAGMRGGGRCSEGSTRMTKHGSAKRDGTSVRDHYQAVTDRIIEALAAGTTPWRRPWRRPLVEGARTAMPGLPCNAITGRTYRGVNAVLLSMTQLTHASDDPRWMTYRQAVRREVA